jgi:hypothetical protein
LLVRWRGNNPNQTQNGIDLEQKNVYIYILHIFLWIIYVCIYSRKKYPELRLVCPKTDHKLAGWINFHDALSEKNHVTMQFFRWLPPLQEVSRARHLKKTNIQKTESGVRFLVASLKNLHQKRIQCHFGWYLKIITGNPKSIPTWEREHER